MKISEATLSLSNEKGFSAMSMRDLSARAGLSMGALYSYFSNKDELLDMIQQQSLRVAAKVLVDQLTGIDDPLQKILRNRCKKRQSGLSFLRRKYSLTSLSKESRTGPSRR
ncbi:MAG: helix-turn-helix transcriptional regulator [Deltaproteobacteria bacterium]|nr:helix-turn-helix transcriptional regulator [Deltaproteobacteria bacterium]